MATDPWAWQQQAAATDPLYQWQYQPLSSNPQLLEGYKPILQQQGLWRPEWDAALAQSARNVEDGGGYNFDKFGALGTDFSALNGYQYGTARSEGYNQLHGLFSPDGQMLNGDVSQTDKSWKGSDYATAAAIAAAAYGANAYGLGGAGGASGAGGAGGLGAGGSFTLTPAEMGLYGSEFGAMPVGAAGAAGAAGAGGTAGGGLSVGGMSGSGLSLGGSAGSLYAPSGYAAGGIGGAGTVAGSTLAAQSAAAPWLAGANLATGILGAGAQGRAANQAANAQQSAAQAGIAQQQAALAAITQALAPYTAVGPKALSGQSDLAGINGPEAQARAIEALKASPQFTSAQQMGEERILANASATGNLRGGNVQAALAQFSPALLSQTINDQFSRLGGLTAIGQNSAAGVGTATMGSSNNVTNLLQQQGAAAAGGALAQGRSTLGYLGAINNAVGLYFGLKGGF